MPTATQSERKPASRRSAREQAAPRGRKAKAEAKRKAKLAKLRARSGDRWRIHYDIDGPRVRLGLLWFVGAMVACTIGVPAVVVYFGVAFAAAAAHALRTWRARGQPVDPRVALCATGAVVSIAGFGSRAMGAAVLGLVVVALVVAWRSSDEGRWTPVAARAGLLLQVVLPTSVAGGCVVLLAEAEIWAAISLVLIVSAYETGDFLIGSGASNSVEGPVAGGAAVLVTALVVAASGVSFDSVSTAMIFGVAVAPLAFAGQILGSGILPHARAFAPALRRIDSLLLTAPVWYLGLDRIVL